MIIVYCYYYHQILFSLAQHNNITIKRSLSFVTKQNQMPKPISKRTTFELSASITTKHTHLFAILAFITNVQLLHLTINSPYTLQNNQYFKRSR